MPNKALVAPEGILIALDNDHNNLRKIEVGTFDPRVNGRPGTPGDLYIYTTGSATYLMVKSVSTDPYLWVMATPEVAAVVAKFFTYLNIATADTDIVHALYDSNSAAFPGPFTNPAIPRNLTVTKSASWDGGTITVVGTNQFDEAISETFSNVVETTVGTKIFKTVTGATKSIPSGVAGNGASIGTGVVIGVVARVAGTDGILFADGVDDAVVVDPIYSSFTPTTAPNGAHDYQLIVNVLAVPLAVASIAVTGADGDNSIAALATNQYTALATYNDSAVHALSATDFTWASSNTAVATVNASGLATGVAAGTAVITAYYKGITGTAATLTVT